MKLLLNNVPKQQIEYSNLLHYTICITFPVCIIHYASMQWQYAFRFACLQNKQPLLFFWGRKSSAHSINLIGSACVQREIGYIMTWACQIWAICIDDVDDENDICDDAENYNSFGADNGYLCLDYDDNDGNDDVNHMAMMTTMTMAMTITLSLMTMTIKMAMMMIMTMKIAMVLTMMTAVTKKIYY